MMSQIKISPADTTSDLSIPIRELIRQDNAAALRVETIQDITSCGLSEIESLRKNGIGLIDVERFVVAFSRMPKDVAEIQDNIAFSKK